MFVTYWLLPHNKKVSYNIMLPITALNRFADLALESRAECAVNELA